MADRKAVIKNADMSEDMQQDAIDCATQALEKYNIEKDIAAFIKKEFDKKIQPYMALYRWPQLWLIRHPRDETLHLLLPGSGCHPSLQVWLDYGCLAQLVHCLDATLCPSLLGRILHVWQVRLTKSTTLLTPTRALRGVSDLYNTSIVYTLVHV